MYLLVWRASLYLGSFGGERKSLKGVISLILVVFIVQGLLECRTQGYENEMLRDVLMNCEFRSESGRCFGC